MDPKFTFKGTLWKWKGYAAWHFITVPLGLSKDIKGFYEGPRKGFGSLPVKVTIGSTTWKTSIFPEKKGTYILPVKAEVRKNEGISEDDSLEVSILLQ